MKKLTAAMLIITAAFFLGLGGVSKTLMADASTDENINKGAHLDIITLNKPQYEAVKSLVLDKHNVECMFNNNNEMKKFKYDEKTIKDVSSKNLLFYLGVGNENASVSDMISNLDKSNLGVINLSRGIRELRYKDKDKDVQNSYYYLGIPEYKIMLYNIKSALQEKDPVNRGYYEENYNKIVEDIDKLKDNFINECKDLNKYNFILEDNKLEYFFRGLGIEYNVLPKGMNLKDYVKKNKLDTKSLIFVQDKKSKNEVKGIKTVKLEVYNDNKSFKEEIEYNINKLKELIKNK